MRWTDAYLSIPFVDRGLTRAGCDCYGLCRLILQEQFKCELPDYAAIGEGDTPAKVRGIRRAQQTEPWRNVPSGLEGTFDLVLMRGQFRSEGRLHSRPIHMGLVVEPGRLIHTEEGSGVTIVEYRKHVAIRSRIDSFWRREGNYGH